MGLLNPSIADEAALDPTVKRQVRRAYGRGYGSLFVFNAHALVETYRKEARARLRQGFDIIGPENDTHTRAVMVETNARGGRVVVGWGEDGDIAGRGRAIAQMATELDIQLYCLGTNRDGQPRHPLYVSYQQEFIPWNAP